ncbi:MAG: type II secretion system F family protein [Eubacteriales bacterium]|nr:type II secretion system F family protein [Eubacteriales bacterium]MDD4540619.1 type II secretion system F family protein [Eubacteriales bacterium]
MKNILLSHGSVYLRFSILGLLLVVFLGIPYGLNIMQEPAYFVIAALILGLGFAFMWQSSYRESKKKHYLHFLSYLSGRLNMGVSLERALYESVEPLAKELGQHQLLIRTLKSLRSNLDAQMSLDDILQLFAEKMNLSVCTEDMRLLTLMANAGGKVEEFIKQRHRSLSTQMSIQADVATEYKGKSTEAILLSAMPFFMAFFFLQKNVQDSASNTPVLWRGLLFIAAVFSIFLVMQIVSWREPAPASEKKSKKPGKKKKKRSAAKEIKAGLWTNTLTRLYLNVLPGNLGLRLSEAMATVSPDGEASWKQHFHEKKLYLAWGLVLFLFSRLIGTVSISIGILVASFPFVFHDIALMAKARDMRIDYRYYAPGTISTMEILLSSQLTLERSLQILGQTSAPSKTDSQPLQRDIRQAVQLLDKGYSGYDAVHFLAERCPLPEIQSALQLMARYSQQGGAELLELLHLQTQHIWQLFRHTQRSMLEHRMMRLIIPMALDLFIIIATIALPFVFEFGSLL